jgi:hypothetical protein
MSNASKYLAEAIRLTEAAARISSEKEVVRDDGTRVPDRDPMAYKDRAFECLALAVGQLAHAVEELSRR